MKTLKLALILGLGLSAIGSASAASFKAPSQDGTKKYSRSESRAAARFVGQTGGGGTQATDAYCVWQDSGGNWNVQKVNLLTRCINSIKVVCTDGQCSA